jgi:hypothetical protein
MGIRMTTSRVSCYQACDLVTILRVKDKPGPRGAGLYNDQLSKTNAIHAVSIAAGSPVFINTSKPVSR